MLQIRISRIQCLLVALAVQCTLPAVAADPVSLGTVSHNGKYPHAIIFLTRACLRCDGRRFWT
jgi:hypothetical protein